MEENNNSSFILILRHGERADCISAFQGDEIKPSLDPELTDRGLNDAKLAGEYIRTAFIEKYKFDNIFVFSSPFLRSLQTACQIAKQININEVTISFGISEKLEFNLCEGRKPFDRMTACMKDKKELLESSLGCKILYKDDESLVGFPEVFDDCFKRFDKYLDNIIDGEKKSSQNNLIILSSHGVSIDIIRKKFNNQEEILADYCCISGIEVNKKESFARQFLNAYNKHIKRKENYKIANGFLIV